MGSGVEQHFRRGNPFLKQVEEWAEEVCVCSTPCIDELS